MKLVNRQTESTRPYTDKRTKAWKYYVAHAKETRVKYEKKNPVPPPIKANPGRKITFMRFSPLKF